MTTRDNRETGGRDDGLESFFTAARAQPEEIAPAFLARLADEAAQIAGQDRSAPPASPWAALRAALGGWPALAGLATAGLAGLWIGITPPEVVQTSVEALWLGAADTGAYLEPGAGFAAVAAEG